MDNFKGLEGLRGWLAWIVVMAHLILLSGTGIVSKPLLALNHLADPAVSVFIILSGFVITHLIIGKHEPYRLYIARRFLRIYPAYLISLLLAVLVLPMGIEALMQLSWVPLAGSHHQAQALELANGHGLWHYLAHLTLLHGMIPNQILNESQYMFFAPAWSLSLEWQFYIVAPLVIWLLNQKRHALITLGVIGASFFAYQAGIFGHFFLPSSLPGAMPYFLIGMGTRMVFDKVPPTPSLPIVVLAGFAILTVRWPDILPFAMWAMVICYAQTARAKVQKPDLLMSAMTMLLESRLAVGIGKRSYSVYILHWMVISFVLAIILKVVPDIQPLPLLGLLAAGSIPLILLGAEALYRWVELPSIKYGKSLGKTPNAKVAN